MIEAIFGLLPLIMIAVGVALSFVAFRGGYHFAHLIYLEKMKRLNDEIFKADSLDVMREMNSFLEFIGDEKNRPSAVDWLKWGIIGRQDHAKRGD